MNELLELIEELIDKGIIKNQKDLAAILYHEFCHVALDQSYELTGKLRRLED